VYVCLLVVGCVSVTGCEYYCLLSLRCVEVDWRWRVDQSSLCDMFDWLVDECICSVFD
jgi:hypothetical protein